MERMYVKKSARLENDPCAGWALLLPDAADGLLSATEQTALNRHLAVCPRCSGELAEAQRGLAWLTVLREQIPEPPASLLTNILAQTTGAAEAGETAPEFVPSYAPALPRYAFASSGLGPWSERLRSWLGFEEGAWSSLMQPRLAMTGAMAFFSICLTLNLTGFSVKQLDAQTLRKGGIHRTVAETGASVVRSIEGIRMVYRVQSRVNEMRAQNDNVGARR
jgi:hypothetical protein